MKTPINKVMVYESLNRKIIFEPDLENPDKDEQYIRAKDKCNSRFLKDGLFAKYTFAKDYCRTASAEEIEQYMILNNNFISKK